MGVSVIVHNHLGASSPTRTTLINGAVVHIRVADRASSATVDVDETGGAQRKLVDLGASTTTTDIYPAPQNTNNTGTGLGVYTHHFMSGTLTVTSSANCTVIITYLN